MSYLSPTVEAAGSEVQYDLLQPESITFPGIIVVAQLIVGISFPTISLTVVIVFSLLDLKHDITLKNI